MRKTALFFAPHPDDVEFGCSFYYMAALEQGYRVVQVVMTNGEFGTPNLNFKGIRISRIRKKELENATKVFETATKNRIEVIRLGYTDGYLPFTAKTRKKIVSLIQEISPSMIFAPDPWYSKDYHPDHINTGRLVVLALKQLSSMLDHPIPLILYYSFAQNRYIIVKKGYLKTLYKAISQYKSQIKSTLNAKLVITILSLFIARNFIKFQQFAAGYRNQVFNTKNEPVFPPKFQQNSLRHRIKYHLFHFPPLEGYEKLHNLRPEEIGIEIKK